jgi:predicted methyltransferase
MRYIFLSVLTFSTGVALGQDPIKNVYTETAWKDRDRWQEADVILQKLNIGKGGSVADVGSHEGYMTMKLAPLVGETGKVYAVDLDQLRLDKLKTIAAKLNVHNVEVIHGLANDPNLPGDLDAVLIMDAYHEMKAHKEILQKIKTALKPGGRLVICEPIADERRDLDREDQERRHEVGMNFVIDDLIDAGFKIISSQDPFVDREKEKGDKMWIVVSQK